MGALRIILPAEEVGVFVTRINGLPQAVQSRDEWLGVLWRMHRAGQEQCARAVPARGSRVRRSDLDAVGIHRETAGCPSARGPQQCEHEFQQSAGLTALVAIGLQTAIPDSLLRHGDQNCLKPVKRWLAARPLASVARERAGDPVLATRPSRAETAILAVRNAATAHQHPAIRTLLNLTEGDHSILVRTWRPSCQTHWPVPPRRSKRVRERNAITGAPASSEISNPKTPPCAGRPCQQKSYE